jgi:hypothetical protein
MRKRTGSSSPANRLRSNSWSRQGMACNRLMSMRTWGHALVQMALYVYHANTWSLTLCDPPPECPIAGISHRGYAARVSTSARSRYEVKRCRGQSCDRSLEHVMIPLGCLTLACLPREPFQWHAPRALEHVQIDGRSQASSSHRLILARSAWCSRCSVVVVCKYGTVM